LGDGPIIKVVDLPKLYIFSFYRFLGCIKKFEVILNLQKPYFCPLLNSNPNFKNYLKSEFGHKSKLVELEILKISYLGNFFKLLHVFGRNFEKIVLKS
jgi:hypothetical protein